MDALYLRWTTDEAEFWGGVEVVFTEVDRTGHVHREVGLDRSGTVVHKKPSAEHPYGRDGFFHLIDLPPRAQTISEAEFEKLWSKEG